MLEFDCGTGGFTVTSADIGRDVLVDSSQYGNRDYQVGTIVRVMKKFYEVKIDGKIFRFGPRNWQYPRVDWHNDLVRRFLDDTAKKELRAVNDHKALAHKVQEQCGNTAFVDLTLGQLKTIWEIIEPVKSRRRLA